MSRSSPPWWSNPSAAMRYAMAALSIVAAIVAGLLLDAGASYEDRFEEVAAGPLADASLSA